MDKADLFRPRLAEEDVEIPDVGTVRVRALSRLEAMHVQAVNSLEAKDRRLIAIGLVDPKLTEDEVRRWQEAAPASELEVVTEVIGRLSGMLEGSAKEAYKSPGDGSDAGVRVLPGEHAEDDGGPAA